MLNGVTRGAAPAFVHGRTAANLFAYGKEVLTARPRGGAWLRTGAVVATRAGNAGVPAGTDANGCDVLSRIIYAAWISLLVGVTAVALGAGVGVVAGLLSGYYGGALDAVLMRLADVQFAFPFILLAIAIVAKHQEYVLAARRR